MSGPPEKKGGRMAVTGGEPISSENLQSVIGGGVIPLINALSERVAALEDRPETVWAGLSDSVTLGHPLSYYEYFDVYAEAGVAYGVPAQNGYQTSAGGFWLNVSETVYGGSTILNANGVDMYRIDAKLSDS